MSDRGTLFGAPMVRALLDGSKTQTRREISPMPVERARFDGVDRDGLWLFTKGCFYGKVRPSFVVGDRLWVRETYYQRGHWEPVTGAVTKGGKQKWAFVRDSSAIWFEPLEPFRKGRHHKDPGTSALHKRLGRFMPRRASRLTLIVEDVRVERLQDISEEDARAEGVVEYEPTMEDPAEFAAFDGATTFNNAVSAYRDLWLRINGPGSWEANPWVVAVTFRVVRANIDQVPHD